MVLVVLLVLAFAVELDVRDDGIGVAVSTLSGRHYHV